MDTQGLVAAVDELFRILQWTKFTTTGATIILFDHIITIDQEVKLIWHTRWSLGKLLFVIARYYNLFAVAFQIGVMFFPGPTEQLCVTWIRWQWCTGLFVSLLAEVILQLRIYAMYGRSKKIMILLVTSFFLSCVGSIIILTEELLGDQVVSTPLPGLPFLQCLTEALPSFWWTFWLPTLAFELLLFGLALYKGFESIRAQSSMGGWSLGKNTLDILVQDSIFYFLVVFSTYLANFLFWTIGGVKLISVILGFTVAMPSVMAQRLLLNIRHNYHHTTLDTAQGCNATWLAPNWPTQADVGREREAEDEDRSLDCTVGDVVVETSLGGSDKDSIDSPYVRTFGSLEASA